MDIEERLGPHWTSKAVGLVRVCSDLDQGDVVGTYLTFFQSSAWLFLQLPDHTREVSPEG